MGKYHSHQIRKKNLGPVAQTVQQLATFQKRVLIIGTPTRKRGINQFGMKNQGGISRQTYWFTEGHFVSVKFSVKSRVTEFLIKTVECEPQPGSKGDLLWGFQ